MVPMAETPPAWLDQLSRSGTARALLGYVRQDEEVIPGETIPDRVAAGFAGGGSLWTMTTETGDGRALGWRAWWKVGYPDARDGRIWAVRYTATAAEPQPVGRSIEAATTELKHALAEMSEFAWSHEVREANLRFTSALALLEGAPDPMPIDNPAGPADTLQRTRPAAAARGAARLDVRQHGTMGAPQGRRTDMARPCPPLRGALRCCHRRHRGGGEFDGSRRGLITSR